MKRRLFLSLCLLALCACTACSPYWYKKPDRFLVQNSRLNWAQIFYQASESAPRVRCDLRDNGLITILEGKSVTVGDDFNIEYDKPDFGDVRKYYYQMDPDFFRQTLQLLVDTGLMEEEEIEEGDPVYPKVLVRGNINHHVFQKFTVDPDLIAEIRSQLFQFKMSGQLR